MSKAQGFVHLKEIVVAGTDRAHNAVRMQDSINLEADEHITLRSPENDRQARSAVNQRTVSVIIPYSRPEKIDNCIRSMTDEYHPEDPLEIIVVGKGSTNVASRWPGVHAIDSGPIFRSGKARNLGAKAASGKVLLSPDGLFNAATIIEVLERIPDPPESTTRIGSVSPCDDAHHPDSHRLIVTRTSLRCTGG